MKTTLSVNFTKFNTNKKDETVLEFQVRGDLTDEQILSLHKLKATGSVMLNIGSAQMDIDDVRPDPREGVRVTVHGDGTADVDGGQMTIEEASAAEEIDEDDKLPGLEDDDADLEEDGGDKAAAEDEDPGDSESLDTNTIDDKDSAEAAETNNDDLPDF